MIPSKTITRTLAELLILRRKSGGANDSGKTWAGYSSGLESPGDRLPKSSGVDGVALGLAIRFMRKP
jgi:hypothetical protein